MEDNDPLKGYKIRWVQTYNLDRNLTGRALAVARAMLAEINENQMLEDSGYVEANEVINHIKSL